MAVFSQETDGDKKEEAVEVDLFFNEFTASINMTTVQNDNTSNGIGGGLGIYRSWRNNKIVNIVHGLEYNYSSQTKDRVYEGSSYAYYDNVKYKMHNISVPVLVRFSFGEKTKLFVETGGFMEFGLGSKREGVYKTTNQDGAPLDINVKEDANLKYFNYGFSAGFGARIPVSKVDLLIKLDYKFGIPDLYTYDEKIYNRYLRLSFGVNLR
jgi:hypothetical protein